MLNVIKYLLRQITLTDEKCLVSTPLVFRKGEKLINNLTQTRNVSTLLVFRKGEKDLQITSHNHAYYLIDGVWVHGNSNPYPHNHT